MLERAKASLSERLSSDWEPFFEELRGQQRGVLVLLDDGRLEGSRSKIAEELYLYKVCPPARKALVMSHIGWIEASE